MRSASAPDSYTHNTSRVNNPPAGLANADTESAHKTYNHAPPPDIGRHTATSIIPGSADWF